MKNESWKEYAYQFNYYPKYTGSSNDFIEALKEMGIDSSYENRERIAKENTIPIYFELESQHKFLLAWMKEGRLIKSVKDEYKNNKIKTSKGGVG